ncbi:MAG: sodium:proton antiporter [Candidatus Hadarchaeia archaeon]
MISLHYIIAMLLFILGLYCVLIKRNLIKMVIGLQVMTNGIHLLLISIGYREGGIPAILGGELLNLFREGTKNPFTSQAVDPLPQVLVLTSIVIDICIIALALSLSIYAYRKYETLDPRKIRELRG